MIREEQKTNAAKEMYPAGTQNSLQFRVGFATGVDWADEHPKEGLWDANKVLAWISQNIESYCKLDAENFNNLLFDLCKAMEG